MASTTDPLIRGQLQNRRERLASAAHALGGNPEIDRLLVEVDGALKRLETGTYGLCQTCHEPIESERLLADPLVRFCLDHLTTEEQAALERDMELAAQIQAGLLPKTGFSSNGWETDYRFEGVGPVSGDYCDLIPVEDGRFFFAVGDASGKGVSASLLMTQLHTLLRVLVSMDLPLSQLMARANRVFCESTLPAHYATLVCGWVSPSGEVEIANAGHLPPLLVRGGSVETLPSTGLPLGMFCEGVITGAKLRLEPGNLLILYTDGITEMRNPAGEEYGITRLVDCATLTGRKMSGSKVIKTLLDDLTAFRDGGAKADDLTMMVLRRA